MTGLSLWHCTEQGLELVVVETENSETGNDGPEKHWKQQGDTGNLNAATLAIGGNGDTLATDGNGDTIATEDWRLTGH